VSQELKAGPTLPVRWDVLFPLRVERELDLLFFRAEDDFAKGISNARRL
jgi:hypothetical protein